MTTQPKYGARQTGLLSDIQIIYIDINPYHSRPYRDRLSEAGAKLIHFKDADAAQEVVGQLSQAKVCVVEAGFNPSHPDGNIFHGLGGYINLAWVQANAPAIQAASLKVAVLTGNPVNEIGPYLPKTGIATGKITAFNKMGVSAKDFPQKLAEFLRQR